LKISINFQKLIGEEQDFEQFRKKYDEKIFISRCINTFMGTGIGIVIGIIIGFILCYLLFNAASLKSLGPLLIQGGGSSQSDSCQLQIQSALNIGRTKAASTTQISIANTTDFSSFNNQTINQITQWVNL
jgi:hypothetical protein